MGDGPRKDWRRWRPSAVRLFAGEMRRAQDRQEAFWIGRAKRHARKWHHTEATHGSSDRAARWALRLEWAEACFRALADIKAGEGDA